MVDGVIYDSDNKILNSISSSIDRYDVMFFSADREMPR